MLNNLKFAFIHHIVFYIESAITYGMSSIDYVTVAIITVFTSFFAGVGSEIAKEVISHVKKVRNLKKLQLKAK